MPAARNGVANPHRPTASELSGTAFDSGGNFAYRGGPAMHANRTYAIYWSPAANSVPASYQSLLNRYLADVAADSGAMRNVYASDTQYYDGAGQIAYSSQFAGAYVDTKTAIPDRCSSEYSAPFHVSGCVLDSDIQAEVQRALAANPGWTSGRDAVFFVFTPPNVGSCFGSAENLCAYNYYCAYHSDFYDSQSRDVLYANQPYTDSSGVGAPGVCSSGQFPNGDWADATANVLSHEHNEPITDPTGTRRTTPTATRTGTSAPGPSAHRSAPPWSAE